MPNTKKVFIYKSSTEISIKSKNEICFANLENNNTFVLNLNEIFENFGFKNIKRQYIVKCNNKQSI